MPYLEKEDRNELNSAMGGFTPHSGGELQYAIAKMINRYYGRIATFEGNIRYKHIEEVMGALNGANMEHYRMVVAPYEDLKIKENGGVYDVKFGKSY